MENFSGNNVFAHPRGRLWHSPAFRSTRYGCQAPSLAVQLSALVPAAGRETLQPLVPGEAGQPAVQDCFCLGTLGLRGIPQQIRLRQPVEAVTTFLVEPGNSRGEKMVIQKKGWTSFLPNPPLRIMVELYQCPRREPCPPGTGNQGTH